MGNNKKVIEKIQALIADTIMTENEGCRRCLNNDDLNEFETWCQLLEVPSDGKTSIKESVGPISDVSFLSGGKT